MNKIKELEEKYCAHYYHSINLAIPEQYRFHKKMIEEEYCIEL